MDDTQQSRVSDAAATRKRRSSILKSQRPPRTPFSELEFNVATPTETAKSRRVSFSRRTGVAEFVTNEATTTWKNFYEEHNKSLESSGNESGANAPRAPIGHIGKRIFDQQFQEVEAVDFGSTLDNHSSRNINTSMNNMNFTQQLASLECMGDDKLAMPLQNFEMSALTDHQSKLFGDDLAVPTMGEMSGRIDINFSVVQPIGEVKDDLDEIQKDLERAQNNVVCSGPFTGRKSLSEYIEVDLNATHVTIKNDDDDMSITDTVHSPKVQDISKNSSLIDKKCSLNKDWVADKENFALNPYVTPRESTNFAVNDESHKILVFDGKRLTVQSDRKADMILKSGNDTNLVMPMENKPHQRKTIVLNVNDDLPNFVNDPMSTSIGLLGSASFKHSRTYDDYDVSITQPVPTEVTSMPEKNATSVNEVEIGSISFTQAVSNVILPAGSEKRRTIVFENDNCDISVTQALPSKILGTNSDPVGTERRRTILYENDNCDISMTQALPSKIIGTNQDPAGTERRRTILYENDNCDISITQALPSKIIGTNRDQAGTERRRTIVYNNDNCDISVTQALPTKILGVAPDPVGTERRKTILYENDNCDISMTQALPSKIIGTNQDPAGTERRRTILYENDNCDISMTQALPSKIIGTNRDPAGTERRRTIVYNNDNCDISVTQALPTKILGVAPDPVGTERRKTILYENDNCDISVTQALPSNILGIAPDAIGAERRRTIVYENDNCDISMTQALPSKIIGSNADPEVAERRRTILYENDTGNISVTQAIPTNINVNDYEKSKTVVFDHVEADVSMTEVVPANFILFSNNADKDKTVESENRKTIVFENETCDISMTQVLPAKIIAGEESKLETSRRKTILYDNNVGNISVTQVLPTNIFLDENNGVNADKTKIDTEISMTQAVPANLLLSNNGETKPTAEKCKTIVFQNDDGDVSVTRALPSNIIVMNDNKQEPERRKTIIYETDTGNVSMTQSISSNILVNDAKNDERSVIHISNIKDSPKSLVLSLVPETNDKNKVIVESNSRDVSNSSAVSTNFINEDLSKGERKPKVPEDESRNISITLPMNIFVPEKSVPDSPKRNTIVYENNTADVTVAQAVLVNLLIVNNASEKRNTICDTDMLNVSTDKCNMLKDSATDCSDNDVDTQTEPIEQPNKSLKWKDEVPKLEYSSSSVGYNEDADNKAIEAPPKDLDVSKCNGDEERRLASNRHYEKILSSDLENKDSENDMSRALINFTDANDTNELLEMISGLTDKRHSQDPERPGDVIEANEPRRLSVAPNRLSIVLSREDLLNNISMAQAALQRSIEIDESMEDTASDTPMEDDMPTKKTPRVSTEVVKKLKFEEDESTSEASIKSDFKTSPLKKTAFGETSYMKEGSKSKVIPRYLKDVSEDIKALMSVLVKPNADGTPFQSAEKSLKKQPSTCSTEIQANLVTSSQLDLDTEFVSVTSSMYELDKGSTVSMARTHSHKNSPKSGSDKEKVDHTSLSFRPKRLSTSPLPNDRVIVFDQNNPLNNIRLMPIDFSDVHKYEPPKSSETLVCNESQSLQNSFEKMNTQFVGNVTVTHTMNPSGDSAPDKADVENLLSNTSKRTSIDGSGSVRVCEVKDTKVNTVIAMRTNKDLLETRSSLTLVDDTLAKDNFDVNLDEMETAKFSPVSAKANYLKIIYQNDEPNECQKLDSDGASNVKIEKPLKNSTKSKKRNYSPTRRDSEKHAPYAILDVTPKPIVKMQKLSNSPQCPHTYTLSEIDSEPMPVQLTAEKEDNLCRESSVDLGFCDSNQIKYEENSRSPHKSQTPKTKPGTAATIQQIITEYNIDQSDQDSLNKCIIKALSVSSSNAPLAVADVPNSDNEGPDIVNSFTSSKNQTRMREALSATTTDSERTTSSRSRSGKSDWQTDMTETNSNGISESESSVNVVAKIDMLPFMGSHECEWEAAGVDTWCFRLLHGRLRLSVRLAHRHDNATRTRVRADTPVHGVTLETAHEDKRNSIAVLCVRFAAEAMRYFVTQSRCKRAGGVPGLLRRCAGVARVALRWGRAMHEARLHLAYSLGDDGCLSLKVANVPLRSVWEVSLQLELVVDEAREVPWARASGVRVQRVVSDVRVPEHELRALLAPLPRDWGHVPRTIWKIFRFLKNKTRSDDVLGL